MSLFIDIDLISEVLLPDGTWHVVADRSFVIDAFELMWSGRTGTAIHELGLDGNYGEAMLAYGSGTGFEFRNPEGQKVAGPITSIVAVKHLGPKG